MLSAFGFTIQIIGSLALFLFGMKYMSEALQKLAGSGLRNTLTTFTSNRFKAALTGTFITAAVQSSSATTVMIVSFVNAGLLNLTNAIGVIMGSNIGTTITTWIITLFGIKYDISALSIPLIGLGFVCMMLRQKKVKSFGEFLIGFGLLFMGLMFLKDTISALDLGNNEAFKSFINSFVTSGEHVSFLTILFFVLIGTILTVVLQSSSAMMALTIVLCNEGAIPFEMAAALVLGENIGTTFTANIAAAIGNSQAKKAARAHFIFNVVGVIWALALFRFFILGIDKLTVLIEGASPFYVATAIPLALSLYHSAFNIINTFALIWFIPQIESLANLLVKKKEEDDEIFKLQYIDSGFMKVSELALESVDKEIQIYAKRVDRMYDFVLELLKMRDQKQYKILLERTEHYEQISDQMEIEIANYLTKVSADAISTEATLRIRGMLRIIDNLESIADQNFQMAKIIDDKKERKIAFSQEMKDNLVEMFKLVKKSMEIMMLNLHADYRDVEIDAALEMEDKINEYRNKLRTQHFEDLKNKIYSYETGIVYSGLYALLEKTGDFIINVTEAIINEKYTKDEKIRALKDPEDDDISI